jgi:hypothetical protein
MLKKREETIEKKIRLRGVLFSLHAQADKMDGAAAAAVFTW